MSNANLLINLAVLMKRPTGISTYALNLLPYLKPLSPLLLTAEPLADYQCYAIPKGQTPEQGAKGHLKRLLWTQFQLSQIYHQFPAKLLFSPLPEAPLGRQCRFVVMVHDLIPLRFPEPFAPMTLYCRYYLPQVLHQAEKIVCNSEATARDITDFLGIPAQKIIPIPLACDQENFRFLDLPTQNYFLYLGRSVPYKNLQRLIAAFASLPPENESELWLAGTSDPRYTPSLMAQIETLGLTERVKFLDYVAYEQLPILMNQAIALVFPSLWEGFGIPVLEAMACGTPVITSNQSSLPEVAGNAAILVNPYAITEIAEAMRTLAENSAMRSQLRQASLQQASLFSWEKTGIATRQLLEQYL